MPKPYTRVHRLLRIVCLIHARRGCNAKRLARECGTTERTIYRDLNQLHAAGVPVALDPETGGYQIQGGFFLPPVQLSLDEALALIALGEQVGRDKQIPFTAAAGRAIQKVSGHLPRKLHEALAAVTPHVAIRLAAAESGDGHRDVYELVRLAIARRRAVRCAYESLRTTRPASPLPSPRMSVEGRGEALAASDGPFLFRPYHLFFGQRAWYAVGWHDARRGVRTLKLSRFARCESTDVPYAIPDAFSLRDHLGKAWRMVRGDRLFRVELRFDPHVADTVAETHWHDTQDVEHHDDGSITFRCEVDGLDEIVWWVLGYGPHCRVVKPKELIKRVAESAKAAAAQYG